MLACLTVVSKKKLMNFLLLLCLFLSIILCFRFSLKTALSVQSNKRSTDVDVYSTPKII